MANGQACSTSVQCASASCQNSKCAEKVADGQSCYKDNMCQSGMCNGPANKRVCRARDTVQVPTTVHVTQMATTTLTSVSTSTTVLTTTSTTSLAPTPTYLCGIPGSINSNAPPGYLRSSRSSSGGIDHSQCKNYCLDDSGCESYSQPSQNQCVTYGDPIYQVWQYSSSSSELAYERGCQDS